MRDINPHTYIHTYIHKCEMKVTFCGMLSLQYTTVRDGSVVGVTHSRSSMLSHCRALSVACNYSEGILLCRTCSMHKRYRSNTSVESTSLLTHFSVFPSVQHHWLAIVRIICACKNILFQQSSIVAFYEHVKKFLIEDDRFFLRTQA